ncbi:MAG: OprO/OprP family phosphate-selective porin [Thiomicrorhabdus sp.]|nr:OprO/OprP family phosphate-selective porin [Thiomicrorhabdus sp.]
MNLPPFNRCLLLFCLGALSLTTQANSKTLPSKGFLYQSDDGNVKIKLGGRLHLDGAVFNEDITPFENDWMVRRARISLRADLFNDWRISAQYNVSGDDTPFQSAAIRYSGFYKTNLTAGQIQEPFSLEEVTSSNNLVFMERSLANAFSPGFNVGFTMQQWGKNWGFTAGSFWETYIEDADLFPQDGAKGFSGRLTFTTYRDQNTILHFGGSASYRKPDADQKLRIRTQPESSVTTETLVSTGRMRNVDSQMIQGVEAILATGPVTLQGEYISTRVSRFEDKQDETFDGGYLSASWLINGRQRNYSARSGSFGAVKVGRGQNVWEVAIRRSFIDLNSGTGTITGGAQTNTTFALNWYQNKNVRVMLNYINIDTDQEAGDDDPSILQMRWQMVM